MASIIYKTNTNLNTHQNIGQATVYGCKVEKLVYNYTLSVGEVDEVDEI